MRLTLTLFSALAISAITASAGTLTDIVFTTGAYQNDTIFDSTTSPLGITLGGSTANAFLNASDSSVSLGYGSYYAIAFSGYGEHVGTGTLSFRFNGNLLSQIVDFPPTAQTFATFSVADGTVVFARTLLTADRIRIVADGGGLVPDGNADVFYSLQYGPGVPEPGTFAVGAVALTGFAELLRRKRQLSTAPRA